MRGMTPLDALGQAIHYGFWMARRPRYAAPGAVVAAQSPEAREALSRLTPEILATARCYPEDSQETLRRRELSRQLQAFDARMGRRLV